MVSSVNNIAQAYFQPVNFQKQSNIQQSTSTINSFDIEDNAIISSEAKMLNELEKYNYGNGNELNLVLSSVNAKNTVKLEARVIKSKTEMIDTIINMVD